MPGMACIRDDTPFDASASGVSLSIDVEAVLLLPWAISYKALGLYAAIEGVIFILILLGALGYVWRKRGLEWS